MKYALIGTTICLFVSCFLPAASGDMVSVVSSRDNTLFEDSAGSLSNGAGESFFVGLTGPLDGTNIRRGLLYFDVAAALPAGAIINDVTLTLNLAQTAPGSGAQDISLHSALAAWGEGVSVSPGGGGVPATPGDATWLHTFSAGSFWTNVGGDFDALASAMTTVNGTGSYNWNSAGLTGDVQDWLDNPLGNFGWVVLGNEIDARTAQRFNTREIDIPEFRPILTIDYSVPEPGTAWLCGLAFCALGLSRRQRSA